MRNTFKKLKNKLLNTSNLESEEEFDDENLDLKDICFFDEDGRLQELIKRRNAKMINFYKSLLVFNIFIFMVFLFFYGLTFNFLFIILMKITLIIAFSIFIIKPKEMWTFTKDVWNA